MRITYVVRGRVQGVGFRWWVRSRARALGLVGYARNEDDGSVAVCVQGDDAAVERLGVLLKEQPSTAGRPGRVEAVTTTRQPAGEELKGFREA